MGSVEHPSLEAHYIEWIVLVTESGFQMKWLKSGMKPEATFKVIDKPVAAYTQRAFELLKYGLKYEDTVIIPADIQRRMMASFPETWNGGFEVHDGTLEFKNS